MHLSSRLKLCGHDQMVRASFHQVGQGWAYVGWGLAEVGLGLVGVGAARFKGCRLCRRAPKIEESNINS